MVQPVTIQIFCYGNPMHSWVVRDMVKMEEKSVGDKWGKCVSQCCEKITVLRIGDLFLISCVTLSNSLTSSGHNSLSRE